MKVRATSYNTSYTARFTRPSFDFVKTSYSSGTLYALRNLEIRK